MSSTFLSRTLTSFSRMFARKFTLFSVFLHFNILGKSPPPDWSDDLASYQDSGHWELAQEDREDDGDWSFLAETKLQTFQVIGEC